MQHSEYSRRMDGYKELAQLYKILSHPVRLRILEILSGCEACVCHLTAALGQRQPYVSQQLAILREADLVSERRDGTLIYYRLRDPAIAGIIALGKEWVKLEHPDIAEYAPTLGMPVDGCACPECQRK